MTLNEYMEQAMTTCTESSMNDTYLLFGLMAEVEDYLKAVAERLKDQERMAALLNVAFGLFLAMIIAFIVLLF